MKRIVVALAVASAVFCAAPAMARPDCHVGVLAGAVGGTSQHVPDSAEPFTDTFAINGRGIGAEIGCLAVLQDRWRYGLVADLMGTHAQGTMQLLPPNQDAFAHTAFKRIGTLRGVFGYQFGSGWMPYVTAGGAAAEVEMSLCKSACFTESQRMWGAALGAGVQYRVLSHLSLGLEYLYIHFQDKPFANSGSIVIGDRDVSVNPEAQLLRFALNLHF